MAMVNLTEGAIARLCENDEEIQPLLQVTEIRLVNTNNPSITTERYRLLLSDGVELQQGMLATQLNYLVNSGALQKGSVFRLLKGLFNHIQGRTIMIVIDLEVVQQTCPIIGDPKLYRSGDARSASARVACWVGQPRMVPVNAADESRFLLESMDKLKAGESGAREY